MKTFMEQYQKQIEPSINAIDLFIKTETPPYSLSETAELLQIPKEEVRAIMEKENISLLNQFAFFHIMKNGSSFLCQMFARELACGLPLVYTVEHISYIYDLDISAVLLAAKSMGVQSFSRSMLSALFKHIPTAQKIQ